MKNFPHFVYVAASNRLISWTSGALDRVVIKVGISHRPRSRITGLNGAHPRTGLPVAACCGCRDWQLITEVGKASKECAEDLEERFIQAFDLFDAYGRHAPPWRLPSKPAGEGELVCLPQKALMGAELANLDTDIRDLYLSARAKAHLLLADGSNELKPSLNDNDPQGLLDREAFMSDGRDDIHEQQDRAALANEEGFYYED